MLSEVCKMSSRALRKLQNRSDLPGVEREEEEAEEEVEVLAPTRPSRPVNTFSLVSTHIFDLLTFDKVGC